MLRIIFVIIASMFISPAMASNFSFMNEGPAAYFSGDDFKIMDRNAIHALNKTKDNEKLTWRNPKTGTWGYFIPYKTQMVNGVPCRNLKIFQSAQSVTNLATYKFCKIKNVWRVS